MRTLVLVPVVALQPRVVHHIVIYTLDTPQAEADAAAFDAADPRAGYLCYGGPDVSDSRWVGAWAPGVRSSHFPAGTSIRINAGRKAIIQLHYNTAAGVLPDPNTEVRLELAASVPTEAMVQVAANPDFVLAPGQVDVSDSLSATLPVAATLYGVFPHMHQLGTSLRLNVNGACAADVPRWDFNWQQMYFYEQPLALSAGDTVELTCHWNTSGQTDPITFGEGTADEMCVLISYLTVP